MIKTYLNAKILAIKRRLHILIFNDFNPYPKVPANLYFSPSYIVDNNKYKNQKFKYKNSNKNNDKIWRINSRNKIKQLLSISSNLYCKNVLDINIKIKKGYTRKRIYLEFSKNRHAPIDIITKNNINKFKGVIICMQGTNSGAHLNLGEIKMPADVFKVKNGSSLAMQAAEFGFIAVSFERIGFGERREIKLQNRNLSPTIDFSFHSLLYGNSSLGETVAEIAVLVKWLKKKYSSKYKIWLKGYSSAGTTAIAAAASDDNIDGIAVGGCVGLANETILKRGATGYNDIPSLLKWFDQDVMISLISPRPCIIVAGISDHIWPYKFAEKALKVPKIIYNSDKSDNNLVLLKGNKGHTYYPDIIWPKIIDIFKNNRNKKYNG